MSSYRLSHLLFFCTDYVLIQTLSPSALLFPFSVLASIDKIVTQNGENAGIILHGKLHISPKVGLCYYCRVFYPNGKRNHDVTQNNTLKGSTSMICGDLTIFFMLSHLGLKYKHHKYSEIKPVKYNRNPAEQTSRLFQYSLPLQQNKLFELFFSNLYFFCIWYLDEDQS